MTLVVVVVEAGVVPDPFKLDVKKLVGVVREEVLKLSVLPPPLPPPAAL